MAYHNAHCLAVLRDIAGWRRKRNGGPFTIEKRIW